MSNEALSLPIAAIVGSSTPSGAGNFITYRPNYVGPNISGTYTTWADTMDALAEIGNGPRYLTFHDDDIPMSVIIPAGTYDMKNVVWFMDFTVNLPLNPSNAVDVVLDDGVYFEQLGIIDGPINVIVQNTIAPCMRFATPAVANMPAFTFNLKNFAKISINGTQPLIEIDNANSMAALFDTFVVLAPNNGIPMGVFRVANGSALQVFITGAGTNLPNNFITGDGSPGCSMIYFPLTHGSFTNFSVDINSYSGLSNLNIQNNTRTLRGVVSNVGAPGVNNDSSDGHLLGSLWVDNSVSPAIVYVCADNTNGAAVWDSIGAPVDTLEYHDAIVGGPKQTHATIAAAVADNKQRIAVLEDVTETVTISPIANNVIINIAPSVTVTYSAANAGAFIDTASMVAGKLVIHGNGRIYVPNSANRILITDSTSLDSVVEIRDLQLDFSAVTVSAVRFSNLEKVLIRRCLVTGNGVLFNHIDFLNIQKDIVLENNSIYNTATSTGYTLRIDGINANAALRVIENIGIDDKSFSVQFANAVPKYITAVNNQMDSFVLSGINPATVENLMFAGNRLLGGLDWYHNGGSMSGHFVNNYIAGNANIGDGIGLTMDNIVISNNKIGGMLSITSNLFEKMNVSDNVVTGLISISSTNMNACLVHGNKSSDTIAINATTNLSNSIFTSNAAVLTFNVQSNASSTNNVISKNTGAGMTFTMWGPVENVSILDNISTDTFTFGSNVGNIDRCTIVGNTSTNLFSISTIFGILNSSIEGNKSNDDMSIVSANNIENTQILDNYILNDFTMQADGISDVLFKGNFIGTGGTFARFEVANQNIDKLQIIGNKFDREMFLDMTLANRDIQGLIFTDNICAAQVNLGTAAFTRHITNAIIKGNRVDNQIVMNSTGNIRSVNITGNNLSNAAGTTYYDIDFTGGTTANISLNGNLMNNVLNGSIGTILAVGNITGGVLPGNPALHVSSVANL